MPKKKSQSKEPVDKKKKRAKKKPVKKKSVKKVSKKSRAKKTATLSHKKHGDIKKVAAAIPTLISNELHERDDRWRDMYTDDQTQYAPSQEARLLIQKKKRLVWVGVSILMAFILGLWYLNIQSVFTAVSDSKSQEGKIIETLQNDFNEIFDNTQLDTFIEEDEEAAQENTQETVDPNQQSEQQNETLDDLADKLLGVYISSTLATSTDDL